MTLTSCSQVGCINILTNMMGGYLYFCVPRLCSSSVLPRREQIHRLLGPSQVPSGSRYSSPSKPGLLDNAFNFWLMHLFEYPKMHVAQNALRAQTCMWQYWKKHFLTEKYPKLGKKCSPGRLPGRLPTGPVGGWVGYILFYNQLTKCGCWKVNVRALSH